MRTGACLLRATPPPRETQRIGASFEGQPAPVAGTYRADPPGPWTLRADAQRPPEPSIRHFSVPRSAMPSAQRSRLTSWMRERPSQVAGDDAKALLADVVTAAGLQAIDAGSLARLRSRPSASCRSRSPPGRSSADWRFRRRRLSGSSTALPTADRRMGGQRPRVGARPSWSVGASTPSALSTAATSAKRRGVALRVVVHVDERFSPITTPDLLGTASRGRRLHRSRSGLASPQGPARAESYPIAWSRSPQSTTGCHPPRPCALRHGSTCPFLR